MLQLLGSCRGGSGGGSEGGAMLRAGGPPMSPPVRLPAIVAATGSPGGGSESEGIVTGTRRGELMDELGVPKADPSNLDDGSCVAEAVLPTGFPCSDLTAAIGLAVGVLVSEEQALFSPDAPEQAHISVTLWPESSSRGFCVSESLESKLTGLLHGPSSIAKYCVRLFVLGCDRNAPILQSFVNLQPKHTDSLGQIRQIKGTRESAQTEERARRPLVLMAGRPAALAEATAACILASLGGGGGL